MAASMEVDFSRILCAVNSSMGEKFKSFTEFQSSAIRAANVGDVLAVAPTGCGKTLVLQSLPFLGESTGTSTCILFAPLNAILVGQLKRFKDHAIWLDEDLLQAAATATKIVGPQPETISRLLKADFRFILGHPEILTSDLAIRLIYRPNKRVIKYLAVDEAHVITSWGQSQFRPAFLKIGHLRSVLPGCKVVAVTATATLANQEEIMRLLRMPIAKVIAISPEKTNLSLEVHQRQRPKTSSCTIEDEYETMLDFVLAKIGQQKTIIFARLKWCGFAYEYLAGKVPPSLLAQYHAPQSEDEKERIINDLTERDGLIRIVLATEALGMGVDIPDIRFIIHASPPSSLEMYVQQIGRCGRDGLPASAIMFFNRQDIGENVKNIEKAVKDYCDGSGCRTQCIVEYFGFGLFENRTKCGRCDCCTGTSVSVIQKRQKPDRRIAGALKEYFSMESKANGELITDLSGSLAVAIASNCDLASSANELMSYFNFMTLEQAESTVAIVTALKDDSSSADTGLDSEITATDTDTDADAETDPESESESDSDLGTSAVHSDFSSSSSGSSSSSDEETDA